MQNIQKSWDGGYDVGKSLRELAKYNLAPHEPTRDVTTKTDAGEAQREQEGFNIKYQEKLRIFLDRESALEKGLKQAYSYIFSSFCTKTMQQRIEEHPDYNTTIDDPIELLKIIQILMHDPVRAQYPFASMTSALMRLINIKQTPVEKLVDYLKRFKQLKDNLLSYMGKNFFGIFY